MGLASRLEGSLTAAASGGREARNQDNNRIVKPILAMVLRRLIWHNNNRTNHNSDGIKGP